MSFLVVMLFAFLFFGAIVVAMAIGVIFRGKCIRGSCGGEAMIGPDGDLLNCDTCPVRKDRERLSRGTSEGTRVPASD